ncbi:nucleotidyltransferase domain-containing protein [Ramlibacter henchirensis]|uniref:Nucleotidyltransferase domain-containing protein n=1 Tax=Ramlibacter henchirensis TaxID=204072 RepID=A0A4Z0BSR1_9BURK|nr:nucleotidyltransferase domain-containing protein [Ramlibacter henchirensis]TFZ02336.1 nucleotidyltransferase domain-containing protein [Ramlibacter henchirensis]
MDATLAYLFGSRTKARLLRALFSTPHEAFHLRGLASLAGVDAGNAVKVLRGLVAVGLVKQVADARGTRYQADEGSPLHAALRQLFLAADALLHDLREVAQALPAEQVHVFGSMARGTAGPDSDVDMLVVGDLSTIEAQAAFKRVARKHKREVSVLVVDRDTLRKQVAEGTAFWRDVLAHPVITLKGDNIDAALGPPTLAR